MEDTRFIEETFPVKDVSIESVRDKNIRHGHISSIHVWWARRPLASSRATNYSALIHSPEESKDWDLKRRFIARLSKWESSSDRVLLEEARKSILQANDGKIPRVLDPFGGGGAIPLEAMRLGCETYVGEYNPVAYLILKATLEYPQKYSQQSNQIEHGLLNSKGSNLLVEDIKKWANWVLEEVEKEIGRFYPNQAGGLTPVGYLWARTISCQNPSCNAEIPLILRYWLATKKSKRISLYPLISKNQVLFGLVGSGHERIPVDFDPEKGTVSKAIATCLVCGSTVDDDTTRKMFRDGKTGQRMLAVVFHDPSKRTKCYRLATEDDIDVSSKVERFLHEKRDKLIQEWGIDPVPDEPLPTPPGTVYGEDTTLYFNFRCILYGINRWGKLFNNRQKLALITFIEKTRNAYAHMLSSGRYEEDYARAITTYLAFAVDKLATGNNVLTRWNSASESFAGKPDQDPRLSMRWDYAESNPFSDLTGSYQNQIDAIVNVLQSTSWLSPIQKIGNHSATELPYPDNFFDAVFTDPPYYDNYPYSDLADFFYSLLKRSIGHLYPEVFSTPVCPRSKEIIENLSLLRGMPKEKALQTRAVNLKTKEFFEENLRKAFSEIRRVLRPHGITTIVYAHKSTAGWESLINSLLDSGLVITASWPIHTEREARLVAQGTASLASSIYMVARKTEREPVGFYKEIKYDLRSYLGKKLNALWKEGISGADFFIAAIGSSIEIFGRYEKIIDDEGNVIRADKLLEDIRRIVTDYAVKQVLHNGFTTEITPLTRFYVLWRWAYGGVKLEFDDALKLARGVGIDLTEEWNRGFIKKDKEFINILGPEDRDIDELNGSHELIDVLHNVVLLWNKGKNDEAVEILKGTGFGKSDVFYKVAQAISESLPNGREKKLLEVFLSGKERITEHVREESVQRRLFE